MLTLIKHESRKGLRHLKKQVSLDLKRQISKGSGQDADSNPTFWGCENVKEVISAEVVDGTGKTI